MIGLHHFVVTKFFPKKVIKIASVTLFMLIFTGLNIFLGTRTRSEMLQARITHHCVIDYTEAKCAIELARLNPKEREILKKQVETFENHLANRTDQVAGPRPKY